MAMSERDHSIRNNSSTYPVVFLQTSSTTCLISLFCGLTPGMLSHCKRTSEVNLSSFLQARWPCCCRTSDVKALKWMLSN